MANLDKAIACFKELNLHPKVDDFQDKLVMQKVIYLLEKLGIDCGYSYSLYLRGPYSTGLTKDLYCNKDKVEALKTNVSFGEDEKEKFAKLVSIGLVPTMLEIVSTYTLLKFDDGLSENDAIIKLKSLKPYPEHQIAIGISKAKQLFFKPSKDDLAFIRAENAFWDVASDEAMKEIVSGDVKDVLARNARELIRQADIVPSVDALLTSLDPQWRKNGASGLFADIDANNATVDRVERAGLRSIAFKYGYVEFRHNQRRWWKN
jgi:uncharacterized protein YwgA